MARVGSVRERIVRELLREVVQAWIMYGLSVSEMGVIADKRDDMK